MKHIETTTPTTITRREAERQLASEVAILMNHTASDNLRWQGTTIDLMESLHVAFVYGIITNDDGVGLSFKRIVDQACLILHRRRPVNCYEVALRAARRKGFVQLPFLDRYHRRLLRSAGSRPFLSLVTPAIA